MFIKLQFLCLFHFILTVYRILTKLFLQVLKRLFVNLKFFLPSPLTVIINTGLEHCIITTAAMKHALFDKIINFLLPTYPILFRIVTGNKQYFMP